MESRWDQNCGETSQPKGPPSALEFFVLEGPANAERKGSGERQKHNWTIYDWPQENPREFYFQQSCLATEEASAI